jgi:hypothetical protein
MPQPIYQAVSRPITGLQFQGASQNIARNASLFKIHQHYCELLETCILATNPSYWESSHLQRHWADDGITEKSAKDIHRIVSYWLNHSPDEQVSRLLSEYRDKLAGKLRDLKETDILSCFDLHAESKGVLAVLNICNELTRWIDQGVLGERERRQGAASSIYRNFHYAHFGISYASSEHQPPSRNVVDYEMDQLVRILGDYSLTSLPPNLPEPFRDLESRVRRQMQYLESLVVPQPRPYYELDFPNSAQVGEALCTEVKKWFDNADINSDIEKKWKPYEGDDRAKYFSTFLNRLHKTAAFSQKNSQADSKLELQKILDRITKDEKFREFCFDACQASDANCHDNVQSIFDDLRIQFANPARQQGATLRDVIGYQRGLLACQLIDEYVTSLGRGGDPLESGQELKRLLSADLALPIEFKEIKYAAVGIIFRDVDKHRNEAKAYVNKELTADRLVKQMAEDRSCADFLKKYYQATWENHESLWYAASEKLMEKSVGMLSDENSRIQSLQSQNSPMNCDAALKAAEDLPAMGQGVLFLALRAAADNDKFRQLARDALATQRVKVTLQPVQPEQKLPRNLAVLLQLATEGLNEPTSRAN